MRKQYNNSSNKPIRDLMKKVYKKKSWNRTVTTIAGIIVFVTTYMLILPAITLTKNPVCGLEEHVHDDNCYTVNYSRSLLCPYEAMTRDGAIILHHHDENCYDEGGNLICSLPEVEAHQHSAQCYTLGGETTDLINADEKDYGLLSVDNTGITVPAPFEATTSTEDVFTAGKEPTADRQQVLVTEEDFFVGSDGQDLFHADDEEASLADSSRQLDPQQSSDVSVQGTMGAETDHTTVFVGSAEPVLPTVEPVLNHQEAQTGESGLIPQEAQTGESVLIPQEAQTGEPVLIPQDAQAGEPVLIPQEAQTGEPALIPQNSQTGEPLCGKEEIIPHTHTEACHDFFGNLICGMPEVIEHQHTDDCFTLQESGRTLTCTLPEHIHTDDCYKQKEINLLDQQETLTQEGAVIASDEGSDILLPTDPELLAGDGVAVLEEETQAPIVIDMEEDNADPDRDDAIVVIPVDQDEEAQGDISSAEELITVEAVSEPESEYMTASRTEISAELATEVIGEQTTEAVAESITEMIGEQTTEAVVESITETIGEQTTETVAESITETISEQTTEAVAESITESFSEQTTEAVTESITETTGEQTTEAVTECTTETTSERTRESVTEGTTEPVSEQTTEAWTEITTEAATELTSEQRTESTTETTSEMTTFSGEQTREASVLEYRGSDYLVRVSYDEATGIPENAYLDAQEIEQDSEEYKTYLAQAKSALGLPEDKELPREYARFFDIRILVNHEGKKEEIEPEGSVLVEILYDEPVDISGAEKAEASVVHFDEKEDDIKVVATVEMTEDNSQAQLEELKTGLKKVGSVGKSEDLLVSESVENAKDLLVSESVENSEDLLVSESVENSGDLFVSEGVGKSEDLLVSEGVESFEDLFVPGSVEDSHGSEINGIEFITDSFSIYGVIYTVDFHWEVNGKVYDFSIPGGGFVSLEHLVEILGIGGTDNAAVNMEEEAEITDESVDNDTEIAENSENAEGVQKPEEGFIEYDEAIKLNEAEVSEASRNFVANVEKVDFSKPEFVWIGKADEEITVGSIKEANGLEVEYSAELTKEQITEINAQTVKASDWTMISLQPFSSEEKLTITMKNGEQFTIKVTDAQINTHVITADGKDFIITVTYGEAAQIPDGAWLEADEIVQDSAEYLDYLTQARAALDQNEDENRIGENSEFEEITQESGVEAADQMDTGDLAVMDAENAASEDGSVVNIDFARFFDIRIMVNGEVFEPAAPVKVKISYADAFDLEEDGDVLAVHFGKQGIELLEADTDENNREVAFMQSSFSVTGTVVTSNGYWPKSNDSYVMYVQSGNKYYAVAHDGKLHEVTKNGDQLTFPDDAKTFELNDYLWQYESQKNHTGSINYFVYYLDSDGKDHYLNPSAYLGISEDAINLSRNSNGYIYNNKNYIWLQNGSIAGHTSGSYAVPIQFASFPKTVTIHFVDRNGNPLTGVSYTGSGSYPVTQNEDGTFSVPYKWDMGNSEYTLKLDSNFEKTGYTYASTHLAGTRQGKSLTYDGLTIDAALKEKSNIMYYYTDAGKSRAYGSLDEKGIKDALSVPNEKGTGFTDYLAANVNKDIYVILDPLPANTEGQQTTNLDVGDPEFNKTLEYNEDGTYTLSLSVKGHGINAATNPKANVIFVVDTSSSMAKGVVSAKDPPTDADLKDGVYHTRILDTKPALKTLAYDLLLSNGMSGKDNDTVEVAMVSFDGGVVDELGWKTSYSEFADAVDNGLVMHRGTDWEDALKRAYALGVEKQSQEPDQQVFIIFFTDGEGSQYTNFHGQGKYIVDVPYNYSHWYSYFLCRETAKDEARAIVNAGMLFYAVYAYNIDDDHYNGERGSDLLHNLVKYGYNSGEVSDKHFFAKATSTKELEDAFNSILLSIREFLGFTDVVMNDDITSLTSTGINLVGSTVGGFTYTRSGGRFGEGQTWTDAPAASHEDSAGGDVSSVRWNLGSTVLEEGVTYTVSFKVWPSQEAYDWLANLNNGTKTWDDVVAAGLDAPNGLHPQIVKNGDSYSLLTNKPSLNNEEIINNRITYKKTHSETVTSDDIPAGTQMNTPVEGTDEQGNKTITTYTYENGVYTKTVLTEKETYFPNPDPMPLVPERMNVIKNWETSMNTSHPADELKFRVLVDGKYYQNDGSLAAGKTGQANAKVLPVSGANSWTNSIHIAPGIVKYYDDEGNRLSEALVLESGHKYTLEEFDLKEGGNEFLYYTSYEFHSQTMRPMIVDGKLKYLVLINEANQAPGNADTYTIGNETYYVAASGSGQGSLSGTNYRTAELDITKIINNKSGVELTEEELNAETFTYRVTLWIPDGTDPAGIVGYEYVPREQDDAYTLFGYQDGETAFQSDINRFKGKTFRAWNTLVYRDLVEWEEINKRIISKTDNDGNIIWKVSKDTDGYHSITYDMTLNQNEVIRFTNLPTGTKYKIQEIYANYYKADYSDDSEGHPPIQKESNISAEGYEIAQVQTTNGTVTRTAIDNDTVSGIIVSPNVRYYNQFTNHLKTVKTKVTILKTDQDGSTPLPGAVFDLYDEAGYGANPKSALKTDLTSSAEAGKEGTIDLGSLSDGKYYLIETKAPAGYILLNDPVTITVDHGNVVYHQENSSLDDSLTGKTGDFHTGYQLIVINDAGVILPNTGGFGTNLFYLLGILLTSLAGSGLVMRKRRDIFGIV